MDSSTFTPATEDPAQIRLSDATAHPDASEAQEAAILEAASTWIPERPSSSRVGALERPVVIPRIGISGPLQLPMPFQRAYSPVLRLHSVHDHDFLAFIDNLAIVQAAPAPLQLLDAAGGALGIVPYHWAQAAGFGINVLAGAASAAITRTRSNRFLEMVNKDYFAPRGLQALLCKDHEIAAIVDCPSGSLDLVPAENETSFISVRDCRMQALAPYISPLSFDVPPPTEQQNALDKIAARQIKSKLARQEQQQEKSRQKWEKKAKKASTRNIEQSEEYVHDLAELDEKVKKINLKAEQDLTTKKQSKSSKIEEKRCKEIAKIERQRLKLDETRLKHSVRTESQRRESKEGRKFTRMEYLVIKAL